MPRVTVKRGGHDVALALLTPHDFDSELLRLSGPDLLALLRQRPSLSTALEEIQLEQFVKIAETLSKEG